MRPHAFLLGICLVQSLAVFAQDFDRFSLSGQIRHRTEFDARDFNADNEDPWFHLLRTRVGLRVAATADVSAFVQAQDARVFGSENPSLGRGTLDGNAPALDLHQAYFSVTNLFGAPFNAKIGRQEMAYGNQRLIGVVGWSNVGRSFDAGVLSYATELAALDVFAARLIGSANAAEGQNLYGIYGALHPSRFYSLEGFLFVDNNTEELTAGPDAGSPMLTRITTGAYAHGGWNAVDYELELMYQGGEQATSDPSALSDLAAYLVSGALGYTLSTTSDLHIGVQYTVLSGDKSDSDNESNGFNTLFATNHKFYGFMDYFPSILSQQGLKDLGVSIALAPIASLKLQLDGHHFKMARAPQANGEDTYGEEVDLTTSYQYNEKFSLQAGLSAFFPGGVMEDVRGERTAFWFYLMSTVNF